MAFQYEEDTASDVADFFTNLEAFMIAAGWTVESGTGTQDIIFKSIGEGGGRTKLYVRIHEDGTNPEYVWSSVRDDLAGTHKTTEDTYGGRLDAGGGGSASFDYWMLADRDCVAICFLTGSSYSAIYAGIVERFPVTVPDEPYEMASIAVDQFAASYTGRILQKYDGTWDAFLTAVSFQSGFVKNPLDNSYMLPGVYVSEYHLGTVNDRHAGQLKHVAILRNVSGLNPGDTITTAFGGATSWWTVLGTATNQWAFHCGGALPVGAWEGGFSYTSGSATDITDLNTKFKAFLTAAGWTEVANPSPTFPIDYYLYSTGQLGGEDIWIKWRYDNVQNYWQGCAMDDALETHKTAYILVGDPDLAPGDFPVNYIIAGDGDCFLHAVEISGVWCWGWFAMFTIFVGDPASIATPYKMGCRNGTSRYKLRLFDGTWSTIANDWTDRWNNSSPNQLDGTSYIVYPAPLYEASNVPLGQTKYLHKISSTAIAVNDTVTVGSRKYLYLGSNWAVRIQ